MTAPTLLESDRARREARDVRAGELYGVDRPPPRALVDVIDGWNRAVADASASPYVGDVVSEATALIVGAALATRVHVDTQRALHRGPATGNAAVASVESELKTAIAALKHGAEARSVAEINLALAFLGAAVVPAIVEAAEALDPDTVDVGEGFDVVHVSQLGRRAAALAAAAVVLQRRVVEPRRAASTAGVAGRRAVLADRSGPDRIDTVTRLADLEPGVRTAVLARVVESAWIDRPERPYTRLATAAGEELRVHFKNSRLIGHRGSQWLWCRCKAEGTDGDVPYAVIEFEGPTTGAGEVWENWLQVEARDCYDVSPSSIHAFAAFAASGTSASRLDLAARLGEDVPR
jgi:hypothetical protein